MSHVVEDNRENLFKWGEKIAVRTNDDSAFTLYRSFTYRGVKYSQYDSVYFFREGAKETDIGKIIKMWQRKQAKMVKILWFFRPMDIRNFLPLADYEPSWNELFLASGVGKGLSNIIPLEAITGKCSVICTSKDRRNALPSISELTKADYFFSHVFDVGHLTISENFPDEIDAVKVTNLLNQDKDKSKATAVVVGARAKDVKGHAQSVGKDCQALKNSAVKDETSRTSENFEQCALETQPLKKRKIQPMEEVESADIMQQKLEDPTSILDPLPMFSSRSPRKDSSESSHIHQKSEFGNKETSPPATGTDDKDNDRAVEISKRPAIDTRRWFDKLPWEERLKNAREQRTLVYLDNLDPSSTSSDVQAMISTTFKVKAEAKIMPHESFSSPSYGKALVIFESKNDADFVISELKQKCLMGSEGIRPVFAYRSALREPGDPCSFPGHLTIEKFNKRKRREEKAVAVSTSHCAQPNTIEYDMAIQWRMLQARSDLWWKALHKRQEKDVLKLQNQLKNHQLSKYTTAEAAKSCHAVPLLDGTFADF